MRRWVGAVLALALVSCDMLPGAAAKAPAGPTGDIARSVADLLSPSTNVSDARFDSFLDDLDLAKAFGARAPEIRDQIQKGRAGVTKPASSRGASAGRLASVSSVFSESVVLEFAKTLASLLDQMTKASGTYEMPPLAPTSHSDGGQSAQTTSSRSQTEVATSTGARVTLTLHWTYHEKTTNGDGTTALEINEERTMVGAITVCPTAAGEVGAVLDIKTAFTATGSVSATLTQTSGSVFTGYVDDNASLKNVHHVLQDKQIWTGPGGDGNYDVIFAGDSGADASGSFTGGFDASSVTGSLTGSDAAAVARAVSGSAWSFVLNAETFGEAYQQAQRLWRNGRCVMVVAPDYSAETPLEIADQQTPQHDEAVDQGSETKFAVNLKHRFDGGSLSQPVTAALTGGGKKLEPSRLESVPSQLTYTAPDEQDKKASAKLQSTSKRGIGTLVLDFHTGGALTLTITGEAKSETSRIGTVRILDTVKVGPLEFKQLAGDIWQATGAWSALTSSFTTVAGSSDTCTGSDSGTITLMATVETRQGKSVWVVDPGDSDVEGTGTVTCVSSLGDQTLRGVTIPGTRTYDSNGDAAELFMGNLDAFTIPAEGGTVRVHGSRGGIGGSSTSDGTATGKK